MTIGYVITEIGYEYNDEIYTIGENSGGVPTQIYLNKEKAIFKLELLNIEAFVNCDIGSYAYNMTEIVSDMYEFESLMKKYDKNLDEYFIDSYDFGSWFTNNIKKFSPEDQKYAFSLVNLEFYTLYEVEIDDSEMKEKKEKKEVKSKVKKTNKFSNIED